MSRNSQSMTPIQKQAVLVCAICALAILITASVTYVLLATKGSGASSTVTQVEEPSDLATHYQVDTQSAALLTETADAGEAYLNDTLFLGDSNTVRLYNNGLISLQQFCAKEGIGIQSAISEQLVTFKGTDQRYTMAEAVAMMKPRRVVITLGTNDNGMDVDTFINYYTQFVQSIQASYPYTDIIVNTVPPVPEKPLQLPGHFPGKDRRLQHGPADHVRESGGQVPQQRRGAQGSLQRFWTERLLYRRGHPSQKQRPQGSAELSDHACL